MPPIATGGRHCGRAGVQRDGPGWHSMAAGQQTRRKAWGRSTVAERGWPSSERRPPRVPFPRKKSWLPVEKQADAAGSGQPRPGGTTGLWPARYPRHTAYQGKQHDDGGQEADDAHRKPVAAAPGDGRRPERRWATVGVRGLAGSSQPRGAGWQGRRRVTSTANRRGIAEQEEQAPLTDRHSQRWCQSSTCHLWEGERGAKGGVRLYALAAALAVGAALTALTAAATFHRGSTENRKRTSLWPSPEFRPARPRGRPSRAHPC